MLLALTVSLVVSAEALVVGFGLTCVHPARKIVYLAEILNRLFVYLRGLGRSVTRKIENRK